MQISMKLYANCIAFGELRIEIGVHPEIQPRRFGSKMGSRLILDRGPWFIGETGASIDGSDDVWFDEKYLKLGGGLVLIGNASIDGSDDVWFDENI